MPKGFTFEEDLRYSLYLPPRCLLLAFFYRVVSLTYWFFSLPAILAVISHAMPIPAAPLIVAGAGLLGQGLNAGATTATNRQSRIYADQVYARTKRDNLEFWNMVNEYNSPERQMERFKAAGLNPNLIYGSGSAGAGQAERIPTPDVQAPQFRTPEFDLGGTASSALATYFDFEIKQAQVDNLRADNTVKLEDAALKSAQRASVEQGTTRSRFDLELDSELRAVSADARRESLRKLRADIDFTLSSNERAAATTAQSLQEGVERIMNLRIDRVLKEAQRHLTLAERQRVLAAIDALRQDTKLKVLDYEMIKNTNVRPNDPLWARLMGRFANDYLDKFKLPNFDTERFGSNFQGKTPLGLKKYNW